MSSRIFGLGFAIIIISNIGCSRRETYPSVTGLPGKNSQSTFSHLFGQEQFVPRAPAAEPLIAQHASKLGEALKPSTEVAFADTEVDAAILEGRSNVEKDQLLDSARQRYQRALKQDPKNTQALIGLSRLYIVGGEKDRALTMLDSAYRINPNQHELLHRMASIKIQFHDWPGAIESCKSALKVDPENRAYVKTLGLCQAHLGQWDESFTTLMKVMPEAHARYFLGRVLIDVNRPEEGRQQILAAANLDPMYEAPRIVLADYETGRINSQSQIQQAGYMADR